MEEQKINTKTNPRVTLRKMSKGYNWDLSTSEGDTLAEIMEIIDEANKKMFEKYGVKL